MARNMAEPDIDPALSGRGTISPTVSMNVVLPLPHSMLWNPSRADDIDVQLGFMDEVGQQRP